MIQVESTVVTGLTDTKTTTMTIKTPSIQISSLRSDKKVKLHIDTSHKNALIANQGDTVMIKTNNADNGVVVASIQSQQVVVINDQGKLEEEITALSKKMLIGDQELSLIDMFAVLTGEVVSGAAIVSDTGMTDSGAIVTGAIVSGEIFVASVPATLVS